MRPINFTLRRLAALRRPLLSAFLCAATLAAYAPAARAQGEPRVRTDRAVYAEPPLPTLPAAGGIYVDPVFGTEIMRATDSSEMSAPGCGTFYNQWPTFNFDQTKILIRCGTSGDMMIRTFYPATFTIGPVERKTWGSGGTLVPPIDGEYARWEGATWSRTDPDKIWVVPAAANDIGQSTISTERGPQIYTYSVSANDYTLVKDFTSEFGANEVFFEYHFAGAHTDGDYNVFTASVVPEVGGSAAHWLAWRRSDDTIIFNHDNGNQTHFNVCAPDKLGAYIYCGPDAGFPNRVIYQTSNTSNTQTFDITQATNHGDAGDVYNVGRSANGDLPQQRRTMSDWVNSALTLFDWKDAKGDVDKSNDCHTSLMADDQSWVLEGCYDDPGATGTETDAYEDEILQIKMDGSQSIRRLLHTRSRVTNVNHATNGYRANPHPTISRDGRYVAYNSNWEDSGRTDLFIALMPNVYESTFFVRQHYRDFLGRGGDPGGVGFWRNEIEQCGSNAACRVDKRINVSAAFFLSIEFQQTGYLVYRTYKAAYGDATSPGVTGTVPVVRFHEFLPDTRRIGEGVVVNAPGWEALLDANKGAYMQEFVARPRFANAYPAALTPAQFVDALYANAGVTPSSAERQAAIDEFGGAATSADTAARARALRRVAENSALAQAEFNRAFVLMQYFGYLRRNPDDAPDSNFAGWKFWLDKLNLFGGNFVAAEMVKGFIESVEYRSRFGQ